MELYLHHQPNHSPKMRSTRHITMLLLLALMSCSHDNDRLYDQLEQHLAKRQEVTKAKEEHLASVRRRLDACKDENSRYAFCDSLVEQYLLFNADSAEKYIEKAMVIAQGLGNEEYINRNRIVNAYILATSGHYSDAKQMLEDVRTAALTDKKDVVYYYETWRWTYNTWEAYLKDDAKAARYAERGDAYLDTLCSIVPATTADGLYFKAEQQWRRGNLKAAEELYLKCIAMLNPSNRRYASACCALAMVYETQKRDDDFERYMLLAAISDQSIPLKENLAIQELARFLSRKRLDHTRAQRYLVYAVEDAIYYNNRLRLTEIARKLPNIALGYQEVEEAQDTRHNIIIAIISLLALGLLGIAIYATSQNHKLKTQRTLRIALNEKLKATNRSREKYVSLFIGLCAAYIDKYNKFQKTIERKVKAHQTDDLLQLLHTNRMKDTDTKEFFMNFDRAFLNLYPQFVDEFNGLMMPEHRIELKKDQLLNTELRIMAFLRLGIKDTPRIATLLMYSAQTIYNYRSVLKSHAIDKDNFEDNVAMLCEVN